MSVGHQPPPQQPPSNTWTEPPWSGWIETTHDALLILEAARRGLIPRVTRRLVDSERKMITSGSVFVFDEDESGIKRWTDGFFWSPSRILGNFLLYRETDKRGAGHRSARAEQDMMGETSTAVPTATSSVHADFGAESMRTDSQSLSRPKTDINDLSVDKQRERTLMGSLTNTYKFKPDGLMKKTFSVTIGGVAQHLISYYKIEDVANGRLRSPSSLPEIAALDISPEYLDKTHFRNPPKVEIGVDGVPRYRGEADDIEGVGSGGGSGGSGSGGGGMHGEGNLGNLMSTTGMPLLTEARLLAADHIGGSTSNNPNKRGTAKRYDPYGSPPAQKRSRKNTRASDPGSLTPNMAPSGTSNTTTPTAEHQHHSASPQPGSLVPYDPNAMLHHAQQQQINAQHAQHPHAHPPLQYASHQHPQHMQHPLQQHPHPQHPAAYAQPPPYGMPFYQMAGYPPPGQPQYGQPAYAPPPPPPSWPVPPAASGASASNASERSPVSTNSSGGASASPSPSSATQGAATNAAAQSTAQSNAPQPQTQPQPQSPNAPTVHLSDPSQSRAAGQVQPPALHHHPPPPPPPTAGAGQPGGVGVGGQHQAPYYSYYAPPPGMGMPPPLQMTMPMSGPQPLPMHPGMGMQPQPPLQPLQMQPMQPMGMPPMQYASPYHQWPVYSGYPPHPPPAPYGVYGQPPQPHPQGGPGQQAGAGAGGGRGGGAGGVGGGGAGQQGGNERGGGNGGGSTAGPGGQGEPKAGSDSVGAAEG